MSPEALSQLLACTSVPRAVLTHDDRLSMPANVFEELLAGSFFVLHTTASHVLCHCGEAGSLPVRPPNYPNGTLRFFVACRECGRVEIEKSQLVRWLVDLRPLERVLNRLIMSDNTAAIREVVPARLGQRTLACRVREKVRRRRPRQSAHGQALWNNVAGVGGLGVSAG